MFTTYAGARSQFQSCFLPFPLLAARHLQAVSRQLSSASFLPQALLPFCLHTRLKNNQDGRDDSKVDSKDKSEVEYLHSQFPKHTHQQIIDAIEKYGPVRKDIEAHLKK